MNELRKHPYVQSVTSTLITYTDDFKRIFIAEDRDGKLPREIFRDNGFDVDLLGGSRIRKAAYRWRKAYKEQGIEGLNRKQPGLKGKKKEETLEEKNARLEAQIQFLKAENELLKKLEMMERGLKTDR